MYIFLCCVYIFLICKSPFFNYKSYLSSFEMLRYFHAIRRVPKKSGNVYETPRNTMKEMPKNWGKVLYKGKYGNSIYGEPGRMRTKQDIKSLWWIP